VVLGSALWVLGWVQGSEFHIQFYVHGCCVQDSNRDCCSRLEPGTVGRTQNSEPNPEPGTQNPAPCDHIHAFDALAWRERLNKSKVVTAHRELRRGSPTTGPLLENGTPSASG